MTRAEPGQHRLPRLMRLWAVVDHALYLRRYGHTTDDWRISAYLRGVGGGTVIDRERGVPLRRGRGRR